MDIKALLEEIKASPFIVVEVAAPHTGVVEYVVQEAGVGVKGPSVSWRESQGTLLATILRERNKKPLYAPLKGKIETVFSEWSGKFVEAGTPLFTIRHYLTRDEVIKAILKQALYLFNAPERAKYYFVPGIDKKIKGAGHESVRVKDGMDLFIVSRMKRETVLPYSGPQGNIYAVYFQHNENVDTGRPLIGVCPKDQLSLIQDVVNRVRVEWEEPG